MCHVLEERDGITETEWVPVAVIWRRGTVKESSRGRHGRLRRTGTDVRLLWTKGEDGVWRLLALTASGKRLGKGGEEEERRCSVNLSRSRPYPCVSPWAELRLEAGNGS